MCLCEEHSDNSTSDDEYFYDSEYDLDGVQLQDTMVDENVGLRNEIDKGEVVDNDTGRNKRKWVEKYNTTTMGTTYENIGEDNDSDELKSIPNSSSEENEDRVTYQVFNAKTDVSDPQFKLGMLFKNQVSSELLLDNILLNAINR
ncbi:unnamed protein product [Ilex paraguariensis]|uniref:Uncharacterized protein n=1 Tax=Ilex paraguariensis TaxID=185542 RepID=A0ABC8V501_9AQUA